jgi:NAD-dependent SIR2 family protein deacetylase
MSQLYGGTYRPTLTHSFLRLLEKRRVLNACWTQNVDNLERLAGLSSWRLIEAHGTLESQHCTRCNAKFDDRKMKQAVITNTVPVCEKKGCAGFVKPDVVMFGETASDKLFLVLAHRLTAFIAAVVTSQVLAESPVPQAGGSPYSHGDEPRRSTLQFHRALGPGVLPSGGDKHGACTGSRCARK